MVGDITGFSASAFLRGADFIQMPTHVACSGGFSVGGKTGINHSWENLIGVFHQPTGFVRHADLALPDREFSAGIAEAIKYGLIADKAFFYDLIQNAVALKSRDPDALASAAARCCAIKPMLSVAMSARVGSGTSILATPLAMPLRRSRVL